MRAEFGTWAEPALNICLKKREALVGKFFLTSRQGGFARQAGSYLGYASPNLDFHIGRPELV